MKSRLSCCCGFFRWSLFLNDISIMPKNVHLKDYLVHNHASCDNWVKEYIFPCLHDWNQQCIPQKILFFFGLKFVEYVQFDQFRWAKFNLGRCVHYCIHLDRFTFEKMPTRVYLSFCSRWISLHEWSHVPVEWIKTKSRPPARCLWVVVAYSFVRVGSNTVSEGHSIGMNKTNYNPFFD